MMPSASYCIRRHAALALVVALALGGAVPALAQVSVSITSTPTNGTHYVAGEAITTRLTTPPLFGGATHQARMKLDIGGRERQATSTTGLTTRMTQVNFSYTVVADDVDTDGIGIPANSINTQGSIWRTAGFGVANLSHSAVASPSAHKVIGSTAYISATRPSPLTEGALNNATITVELSGLTFASGVTTSSFSLVTVPAISNLSISSLATVSSGDTTATLTLAFSGNFSTSATLAVQLQAAAHSGSTALTTGRVSVTPNADPSVAVEPSPSRLTEANLHGATLALTLDATAFAAAAPAAGIGAFELVSTIPNLSIAQVAGVTAGGTTATLTLAFTGDFRGQPTLAVRLAAASHQGSDVLTSNAITVTAAPRVTVSKTGLALAENPGTSNANRGTYTIVLDSPPTGCGGVGIDFASDNADVTVSPSQGYFSTSGWNTAQTITATAAQDDDGADDVATLSHTVYAWCTGAGYPRDLTIDSVVVAVDDDDTPALVVDAAALVADGVAEGGAATSTVRLATEPTSAVVVAVAASGGVSVDTDAQQAGLQSSLRFDATDWDAPRTVTVRGLPDDDGADVPVTLRHSASGGDYADVPAVEVAFAVSDDDTPAVLVGPSSVEVNEGSTAQYAVVLATAPVGGVVTVSLSSSDVAAATVSPASMTFTASNWSSPRRATVHGTEDTNSLNAAPTISHSASGADYNGATAGQVSVLVLDDEAAAVRIEPRSLSLREGESGVYRVRLNTQPTFDATVTAASATAELGVDNDATPQTKTLTFTTTNWGDEQTVTVTVGTDDSADDETLTVGHSVSGYSGVTSARSLEVRVEDDDTAEIVFDPAGGLSLAEGGSPAAATYTVALSAQPTGMVSVRLSSDDAGLEFDANANLPGDQGVMEFDATDWNVPKPVSARAVADADAATEMAALLHLASGGGYNGVSAVYSVALADADAAPAPTGVTASAAGPTSLSVHWTASSNTGHLVQWRRAGEEWSAARQLALPGGATSARIDGLRTGVEYVVRVLGLNGDDPGDPSAEARARPVSTVRANRAPAVARALEDVALEIGATLEIDLTAAFVDPDGDALSHVASSSDASAVSAAVLGQSLQLRGEAVGVAEIVVRAMDAVGLSASQSFRAVSGPALSVADGEVAEGGIVRLPVSLSPPRDSATTFRWSVRADSGAATADEGEHGGASGEATIAAGETRTEIEIGIADDADVEPAREWFEVVLSAPEDGCCALARGSARVAVLEGVCDRSAAVREALSGGGACAVPTPAELRRRRSLRLRGAGAASLAADDLLGLPALEVLDLGGNALQSLPAGLFAHVPALRFLMLDGNRLSALPGKSFAGLPGLVELRLDGNALAGLPGEAFAGLSGLRFLRLNDNALRQLPAGLFAGLESLRSLRLDGNPGAPFALRLHVERVDAEPWAPGPARLRVALAEGAPFDLAVRLGVAGGELSAASGAAAEAFVAAGGTAGGVVLARRSAGARWTRVEVAPPSVPGVRCNGRPCWRGFGFAADAPLVLFARPPAAAAAPLFGEPLFGEALRLPLQELFAAGDLGGLSFRAASLDESVAVARVVDGELEVAPVRAGEGTVRIEVVATDAAGQSATHRFDVRVEFFWPPRPGAGWRGALPVPK